MSSASDQSGLSQAVELGRGEDFLCLVFARPKKAIPVGKFEGGRDVLGGEGVPGRACKPDDTVPQWASIKTCTASLVLVARALSLSLCMDKLLYQYSREL